MSCRSNTITGALQGAPPRFFFPFPRARVRTGAGAAAWLLFPICGSELGNGLRCWRSASETSFLVCSWATITVLIPTLMRTKNSWYLQPFYPVFAFGIAWLVVRGLTRPGNPPGSRRRQVVLASLVVMVFAVAEGRLVS